MPGLIGSMSGGRFCVTNGAQTARFRDRAAAVVPRESPLACYQGSSNMTFVRFPPQAQMRRG
jgi:hypothetical protein